MLEPRVTLCQIGIYFAHHTATDQEAYFTNVVMLMSELSKPDSLPHGEHATSTTGQKCLLSYSTFTCEQYLCQYLHLWTVLVPLPAPDQTKLTTLEHMTKEQSVSCMWNNAKKQVPRGFQSEPALGSYFKSVSTQGSKGIQPHTMGRRMSMSIPSVWKQWLLCQSKRHCGQYRKPMAVFKPWWSVEDWGTVFGVLVKCQSLLSVEKSSSAARTQMWRW